MKKMTIRTRNKIIRYAIAYLICLALAVLTWVLVKYAETDGKRDDGVNGTACTEETAALCGTEYSVL